MTRLLSLAAAGLMLAGLAATPAAAQPWHGGGGYGYHDQQRWGGGYGGGGRWGHGPRWERPGWGRPHWGPRCRTVMITRFSHWRGHYVQRPVEMCG